MENGCEVYELREGMEYQPMCEDSKVRVYVSLVPCKAEREFWAMEVQSRRHKKRVRRALIRGGLTVVKLAASAASGIMLLNYLSPMLLEARGYEAVGGEAILAGVLIAAVWKILDFVIGDPFAEK